MGDASRSPAGTTPPVQHGWAVEEKDGENAYISIMGWKSKEEHDKAMADEAAKEKSRPVMEGVKGGYEKFFVQLKAI